MRRKRAEPFLVVIVDDDRALFTLEGPMLDDTAWNAAVCQAQGEGRFVAKTARGEAVYDALRAA